MVSHQKLEDDELWIEKRWNMVKQQEEFERVSKYLNKGLAPLTSRQKPTENRMNQFASRKFDWKNKQEASIDSVIATATTPSSSHQKKETLNTPRNSYSTNQKPVTLKNSDFK